MRKLYSKQWLRKLFRGCFGQMIGQGLIKLALKDLFAASTVEICRLAHGGPHRLDHLAKKRLSDELGKSLAYLLGRPAIGPHWAIPTRLPQSVMDRCGHGNLSRCGLDSANAVHVDPLIS